MSSNLVKALLFVSVPARVICECGRYFPIGIGTPVGNEIRDAERRGAKHYERFCESCGRMVLSVDFPRKPSVGEILEDGPI